MVTYQDAYIIWNKTLTIFFQIKICITFNCSEHKTWFQPKTSNVASYNNQVMATSRTADIGAVEKNIDEVQFNAVRINIDEIERQDLITIFKASLKEKFLVFELDIQFLIIKVIMAVVDINKIFLDFNQAQNLNYFHVQVFILR